MEGHADGGGPRGGIPLQMPDGTGGYLVDGIDDAAEKTLTSRQSIGDRAGVALRPGPGAAGQVTRPAR